MPRKQSTTIEKAKKTHSNVATIELSDGVIIEAICSYSKAGDLVLRVYGMGTRPNITLEIKPKRGE